MKYVPEQLLAMIGPAAAGGILAILAAAEKIQAENLPVMVLLVVVWARLEQRVAKLEEHVKNGGGK